MSAMGLNAYNYVTENCKSSFLVYNFFGALVDLQELNHLEGVNNTCKYVNVGLLPILCANSVSDS